jgi:hypothetical protein
MDEDLVALVRLEILREVRKKVGVICLILDAHAVRTRIPVEQAHQVRTWDGLG